MQDSCVPYTPVSRSALRLFVPGAEFPWLVCLRSGHTISLACPEHLSSHHPAGITMLPPLFGQHWNPAGRGLDSSIRRRHSRTRTLGSLDTDSARILLAAASLVTVTMSSGEQCTRNTASKRPTTFQIVPLPKRFTLHGAQYIVVSLTTLAH